MPEKDAFDQWWEWATKGRATDYSTIDAEIHHAVTQMSEADRHDREKVNEAVRKNKEAAPVPKE